MVPKIDEEEEEEEEEKPNQKKCPTCDHWVPEFSFSRHEAFCSRNSWKCRECGVILKVQFKDDHYHCPKCKLVTNKVKNIFNILPFFCCYLFFFYFFTFFFLKNHFQDEHFHCDLCESFPGMPRGELEKHKDIYHNPMRCKCEKEFQLEDLIIHKKFDCGFRKVPCKWFSISFLLFFIFFFS